MNQTMYKKKFNSILIIFIILISFQSSIYDVREKNEDNIDYNLNTDDFIDDNFVDVDYNNIPEEILQDIPQSSEYLASDGVSTSTSTSIVKVKELTTTVACSSFSYYWQYNCADGQNTYLYVNSVYSGIASSGYVSLYTVKSGTLAIAYPAGTKIQLYHRSWSGTTVYSRYFRITTTPTAPPIPSAPTVKYEDNYGGMPTMEWTLPSGDWSLDNGLIYWNTVESGTNAGYKYMNEGTTHEYKLDPTTDQGSIHSPLGPGLYYFATRAHNAAGWSGYSAWTPVRISNPKTPESLIAEDPSVDGVSTITWNEPDPLLDGLVGYWDMDSNEDFTGVNDGTSYGSPTSITDRNGYANSAYGFDGDGDYFNAGNDISMDVDKFTATSWIRTTGTAYKMWMTRGGGQYWLAHRSSTLLFTLTTSTGRTDMYGNTASSGYHDDEWHHVAQSYDGAFMRQYLDGELINELAKTGTISGLTDMKIGQYSSPSYQYTGDLDEVRLYNRALTGVEIQALIANDISSDESSLVAHWDFDGDVLDDVGGYDGTNYGATLTTDRFGNANSAYSFDGTNDYIALPNDVGYTTQFSAFMWFKRDGSPLGGYQILFGGQELEISSYDTDDALRTGLYSTTRQFINYGDYICDGAWHHVGYTFDGTTKKVFIDGQLVGSNIITGTLTYSFADRTIGRYGSSTAHYTNGKIDDVKIFNEGISAKTVSEMYSAGSHWKFDGDVLDSIGNNDGVVIGALTSTTDRFGNSDNAYEFDGNDYITMPFGDEININIAAFSLTMWVKADSPSTALMFASFGDGVPRAYFGTYSSDWEMGICDVGWSSAGSDTTVTTDWTHIGIVFNPSTSTAILYINGDFSFSRVLTSGTLTGNLKIGAYGDGGYKWDGKIDDVKFYNYAMSLNDIHNSYDASYTLYESSKSGGTFTETLSDIQSSIFTTSIDVQNPESTTRTYKVKAISSLGSSDYSGEEESEWSRITPNYLSTADILTYTNDVELTWKNAPNENSVIGSYDMDNVVNDVIVQDGTNNDNDGTFVGTISFEEGKVGDCMTVSGQSVNRIDTFASSFTTSTPFSIATWLYIPSSYTWNTAGTYAIINSGDYVGSHGLSRVQNADNTVGMWIRTSTLILHITTTITRDTWYHIVGIFDPDNDLMSIYNNGEFITSTDTSAFPTEALNTVPFSLGGGYCLGGSSDANRNFEGSLDEVKIYDKALSADEVFQVYEGGDLTSFWDFNPQDYKFNSSGDAIEGIVDWGTYNNPDLSDWVEDGTGPDNLEIISQFGGHKNILKIDDQDSDYVAYYLTFAENTVEDIAFSFWNTDVDKTAWFQISDEVSTQGIRLKTDNGFLQYDDGTVHDIVAITDNTKYNLEISYDIGDTWSIDVNGVSYGSYNFIGTPVAMDRIRISSSSGDTGYQIYFDVLGFLWDGYVVGTNNMVYDIEGNYDGIVNGAIPTTDRFGNLGSAYDFDGDDDYIDLGNHTSSSEYTISLWYNPDVISQQFILGDERSGNGGVMIQMSSAGYIQVYTGSYGTSTTQLEVNNWYHITITQRSDGIYYYVNGDSGEKLTSDSMAFSGDQVYIGGFTTDHISFGRDVDGQIDDVRIYNYSISESEAKQLYQGITYEVYESTTVDGTYSSIQSNINATSTIISQTSAMIRYYKVKSNIDDYPLTYTNYISIEWVNPDTPDTPTSDSPQYTTPISITWNDSLTTGADEVNLQYSTNDVDFYDISGATTNPTSYVVSEGTYYFRVRATNDIGSSYSSSLTVVVSLPLDPGAPICPSPDFDGNLTITWIAGEGSTSAILQMSTDGNYFENISGATSSPTTILNLEEGSYWFKVNSTNSFGSTNSTYSSEIIVSNPAPVIVFTNGNDIEHGGNIDLNFTITDVTTKNSMIYNLTYSYNGGSNITILNNFIWASGAEISYNFNDSLYGSNLGLYNFFVIANDNVDHLNKTSIENFTIEIVNTEYPYFSNIVYNNFEYNTTNQEFTWINIDSSILNPYYKIEYSKDGGVIQTPVLSHSWISGEQNLFDLNFIRNTLGSYNFTITTYDGFTKSNTTSFFVNITNLVYPEYSNLIYSNFEYGESGYNFSWIITDESINNSYYKIEYSKDGGSDILLIDFQSWISGNNYYQSLDFIMYEIGEYEFNITSFDDLGKENSTIFNINITNLIIPDFIDLTYNDFEYSDIGNNITFKLIDISINETENYYKIEYKLNGGSIQTAVVSLGWDNNTINILNLDFICEVLGYYEFNITAYDGVSDYNSTIFYINVTNYIMPEFIGLYYIDIEYKNTGYSVSWINIDFSFNGSRYYKVEYAKVGDLPTTLFTSENWNNNTLNSFSVDFINSILGIYNFNITVYDGLGGYNLTFFSIEVVNLISPVISGIYSFNIEYGTNNVFIVWYIYDVSSSGQYYILNRTIDSVENTVMNNTWENQNFNTNGRNVFYFTDYISQYEVLRYNFTLYVYDGLGLSTNITFYVNVTNYIGPDITFLNNIHVVETNDEYLLEWTIEDPSYNDSTYDLDYKKSDSSIQNIRNDVLWINGDVFNFQITDLGFVNETYNITFYVIAFDGLSLIFNASFFLFVSNGIPIIICNATTKNIEYGGITDFNVKVYDSTVNITSIVVSYNYKEEYTELLNTSWTSEEEFIFTNLSLTLGLYQFNITASDGNEIVDELFNYTIQNEIAPTISLSDYDSEIYINYITNFTTTITFEVSDISQFGGTYNIYYEIDGYTTYVILGESFANNYTFDLILYNLTKEIQVIEFTIQAEDGLGLSSSMNFNITMGEYKLIFERDIAEVLRIIIVILLSVGGLVGLVLILFNTIKKREV